MAIKINWKSLSEVKEGLIKTKSLTNDTPVVFVLLLKDGTHQKKTIKFQDFFKFFWFMYDSTKISIKGLVVTDTSGNILYRHPQVNSHGEIIPDGGNTYVFERWSTLSELQKDTHLNILLAQINDYTIQQEPPRSTIS